MSLKEKNNNEIDMKLGPVTKIDKRNMASLTSWQVVMSLSFFQFMANSEQSRSQIPDA